MDGPRRQLTGPPAGAPVGLGHDLQLVSEVEGASALKEPGVFFTPAELRRIASATSPAESLAGGFSAKEALFKALPAAGETWFWTDAELVHDRHGAPRFHARGPLADHLARHRLRVSVSLSHSGGFVSSVVIVTGGTSADPRLPSTLHTFRRTIRRGIRRVLRRVPAQTAGAPQ
ncbi:holo-ACP synthase [Streptomyces sp. NPDC049577]|uniref:holo-ACP synthase n=1 Tax=Streptomyces sp. NPDC049577 TaxID=3155153 RepID=UPI0034399021